MIYCENITKNYGGVLAVDNVNLYADKGEIVGIIGSNGAGKTTLFNIITGFDAQTSGDIFLEIKQKKININKYKPYQLAKIGVGRTFQNVRLFDDMTVYENIMTGAIGTGNNVDYVKDITHQVGLDNRSHIVARNMPYGERKMTELARCIASGSKLLLLDEPAAGLNEKETDRLCEILKMLIKEHKLTIILIEHNIDFIRNLCTRLYAMDLGKVICEGSPEHVIDNSRVVSAVFGGEKNT